MIWAWPRFGHPYSQNPSEMGIRCNPNPDPNPNSKGNMRRCPYHCNRATSETRRKLNRAELTIAKTSGTVSGDRKKQMANTPLAHLPKCTLFAPPKFCILALFSISLWAAVIPRRKKNGGGGQIRCIMGDVQVVYSWPVPPHGRSLDVRDTHWLHSPSCFRFDLI